MAMVNPEKETRRRGGSTSGSQPSLRLFFAIAPDAAARGRLASLAEDVARAAGGRAPRAGNLHLTVAFLGEVPSHRLTDIEAIGASSVVESSAFRVTLDRVGSFRGSGIA